MKNKGKDLGDSTSPPPKAFITGVTGQDGSYLADLLLTKGYEVHGLKRRVSNLNSARIDHIYKDELNNQDGRFYLHYGDLTDGLSLERILDLVQPDEIYNLAAQSHVAVSFEIPEYTSDVNALGCLRILNWIKNRQAGVRFYQASTSELYGAVLEAPQTENTSFNPQSPYAIAKLYAYWMTKHYRDAYGIFACNGILFNHESERRGETFVTRKVTRGLAELMFGFRDVIYLGNLDAKRDWGHAADYVKMQWLMLQQNEAEDYVIATGSQYSIRELVETAFGCLGVSLAWRGTGLDEEGVIESAQTRNVNFHPGRVVVKVHPKYFRPLEVSSLLGDSSMAKNKLGWEPEITFSQLVSEMVFSDLDQISRRGS